MKGSESSLRNSAFGSLRGRANGLAFRRISWWSGAFCVKQGFAWCISYVICCPKAMRPGGAPDKTVHDSSSKKLPSFSCREWGNSTAKEESVRGWSWVLEDEREGRTWYKVKRSIGQEGYSKQCQRKMISRRSLAAIPRCSLPCRLGKTCVSFLFMSGHRGPSVSLYADKKLSKKAAHEVLPALHYWLAADFKALSQIVASCVWAHGLFRRKL